MSSAVFAFLPFLPGRRQLDLFAARPKRKSFLRKLISGFDPQGRAARYGGLALIGTAVLFALAVAYIVLTPKSYTSEMTLIMPGSGAGTSINLNEIGQASSTTASAFSQASISPTENYKKIMTSRRVLHAAAATARVEPWAFPEPSIKLIDQTQLMIIKLSAPSPETAQLYGQALLSAFLAELDTLRAGEMEIRQTVYRRHIGEFREGLKASRSAILGVQSTEGIVSLDQFQGIVAGMEELREALEAEKTSLAEVSGRLMTLAGLLNMNEDMALDAFTIFTDPEAQRLSAFLSESRAALAAQSLRFGPNHPERKKLEREAASLQAALRRRGRVLTDLSDAEIARLFDLAVGDKRSELMNDLVSAAAERGAINARISELTWQITSTEQRVEALTPVAAELDDLERDHLIREAVFSSALARIDTSKVDVFASYPLVQTLEVPNLPTEPSSPMPKIALAGAFAASVLWVLALVLLWIRLPVLQAILKTV